MTTKKNQLFLSIDVGTQSVRVALFDVNGNIVDIEKQEIKPFISIKPGYSEQQPEYYYDVLAGVCKKLIMRQANLKLAFATITTQRGTVVNLDKNQQPLRSAIIWPDQRRAKYAEYPKGLDKLLLKALNLSDSVIHAVKNGECNWIRQNQSEIWEKTDKYLYLSGYLTYRMVGEFNDSIGNMVGYMPFDYKRHKWVSKSHRNYKMFPIPKSMLPKLVKPSEVLGKITRQTSIETGLPEGLPLIAAASDKACEVLGSGVFEPGKACLSYGTTATVQTCIPKYKEVIRFFPPYPSALPNGYNTEIMIYRGFWMVSWFRDEFGLHEVKKAEESGEVAESYFDELLATTSPGSMGLMLQPYWSPGVRLPGIEAKGAIIGFGDVHTRAHVYRAIPEGLGYALREGLERTERRTGYKSDSLLVSGGGSQSDYIMQITADIFNRPAIRPHVYETSALGAAILGAVGVGVFPSYSKAVESMCRVDKVFLPDSKNRDIYEKLYQRVYLKMYKKMRPLYKSIKNITGYPSN